MDVTLNWKGNMAFEGTADSGYMQKMDAEASVGGENSAARPMEFIALGLAGCTGMDVISILRKKQQPVKDFQVRVHAERAGEHPKVFSSAVIEYRISGRDVKEEAVRRAIGLSAEKYCPAQAMLSKSVPMKLVYKILGDDGEAVIAEGEYKTGG